MKYKLIVEIEIDQAPHLVGTHEVSNQGPEQINKAY
ncbi:MAG: hypothetical protein ACI9EW_001775 [Cellvibrionaceae bacterium]|jgi:hypothetical protein